MKHGYVVLRRYNPKDKRIGGGVTPRAPRGVGRASVLPSCVWRPRGRAGEGRDGTLQSSGRARPEAPRRRGSTTTTTIRRRGSSALSCLSNPPIPRGPRGQVCGGVTCFARWGMPIDAECARRARRSNPAISLLLNQQSADHRCGPRGRGRHGHPAPRARGTAHKALHNS